MHGDMGELLTECEGTYLKSPGKSLFMMNWLD